MTMMMLKGLEGPWSGISNFNIADNYPWTATPPSQRTADSTNAVPRIILREFEQDLSTLYSQLFYWYAQVKKTAEGGIGSVDNPYEDLYHANPTGVTYQFPYFENYDHLIGQTWEKSKGLMSNPIAAKILGLAANAAKFFQLSPGTSVNQPQLWSGPNEADYTITFLLFNTFSADDIDKNLIFKRRLLMSTLHDQRTALLASPPAIFEVDIPGVRYSPAAVITNLVVENVGQINTINGNLIPDAWLFTIRIRELINESRQLLSSAIGGSRIVAITDKPPPSLAGEGEDAAVAGEGAVEPTRQSQPSASRAAPQTFIQ